MASVVEHILSTLGWEPWIANFAQVSPRFVKLANKFDFIFVSRLLQEPFVQAAVKNKGDPRVFAAAHPAVIHAVQRSKYAKEDVVRLAIKCTEVIQFLADVRTRASSRGLSKDEMEFESHCVRNFTAYQKIWGLLKRTHNGGMISSGSRRMGNQCFWISLADAIKANGGPKELSTGWSLRQAAEKTGFKINAPGRMVEMTSIDSKEGVTGAITEILKRCGLKLIVINRIDVSRGAFCQAVRAWTPTRRPFQMTIGGLLPSILTKKGDPDIPAFNKLDAKPVVIVNMNAGHYEFAEPASFICWGGVCLTRREHRGK